MESMVVSEQCGQADDGAVSSPDAFVVISFGDGSDKAVFGGGLFDEVEGFLVAGLELGIGHGKRWKWRSPSRTPWA